MKKRTFQIALLCAATLTVSSCGSESETTTENESKTSTTEETVAEDDVVEELTVNTFVNPDLSMMSEALTKSEFSLEELKNAINFEWNLGSATIVGYAYDKDNLQADSVKYSSQGGMIASADGATTARLAMDYNDGEMSVMNGQLVAVTGTMMINYSDVYDTRDEKCDIYMKTAKITDASAADIIHVNDVMNLKSDQLMDVTEVKNVIADYHEAIIAKGPIKVTCVVKSVFHSGMKNDDGTFMDAQVTVMGAEKDYIQTVIKMKEVPSEDLLNELVSSKKVVTFEGIFDGGSLKDAVLLK